MAGGRRSVGRKKLVEAHQTAIFVPPHCSKRLMLYTELVQVWNVSLKTLSCAIVPVDNLLRSLPHLVCHNRNDGQEEPP